MCWGPNATGGKSSSNKMAKQAALAFVRRTLDRCKQYENTGKSCFGEPLFRDIFLTGTSRRAALEGNSSKLNPFTSIHPWDVRILEVYSNLCAVVFS